MKKYLKSSVDWSYFNDYKQVVDMFMPDYGEGETMASQMVTAMNRLIYKWYNDGDVYDNNYGMEGFANDISGCANWLYKHIPGCQDILDRIYDCYNESEYEDILKSLADHCLGMDFDELEELDNKEGEDSIYSCPGPFSFNDNPYDDEEEDESYYDYDDADSEEY